MNGRSCSTSDGGFAERRQSRKCEKIRFPDGHVAIICCRRKRSRTERQLTPEQQKLIDLMATARVRCAHLASEADRLGLPILAREWDYVGKCPEEKAELQLRAFRIEALGKPSAPAEASKNAEQCL